MKNRCCARILSCLLTAVLLTLFLSLPVRASDDLTIHFFNVGKGDCILIKQAEYNVMLDTGYEKTIDAVLEELQNSFGVGKFDCLILSHYDKDHVGGAGKLLTAIPVGEVYETDYDKKKSKHIDRYRKTLGELSKNPVVVRETTSFELGELKFTIYPPKPYEGMVSNDSSLILLLEFRGKRFLFLGDALDKRMETYLSEQFTGEVDFMKLPHHGFYLTKSEPFKNLYYACKPKYGVITDAPKYDINNAPSLMFMLDDAPLYRLRNGAITITCDGEKIEIRQ